MKIERALTIENGLLGVSDTRTIESDAMDELARQAVFGDQEQRDRARWMIWEIGQVLGVQPASIHDLYIARGRGETRGFTVPAINVRGMAYDTARSIFRVAKKMNAGAFICEIARSEIAYTDQRPSEYVAVILAAALREGFRGPVFIQGDHFQVSAKKYATDPDGEVAAVKQLAREAVDAGFYNIDVDTSTLVDLSRPNVPEQQRVNFERAAEMTELIRQIEPKGVTVSIGGEIGEVGTENSTVEELRAFMDGYNESLPDGVTGLSKISVQSGTSHGGVVLADGSIADVALDLDTLQSLSDVAREEYGLSGAVQHGASTLPDGAFNNFPRTETAEIHLATNFQTMLYDQLPAELRAEIYEWLRSNAKDERKEADTDEQFFYKTRKKALGPFKQRFWELDESIKLDLAKAYDAKFTFLFTQLAIGDTAPIVARFVNVPALHKPEPHAGMESVAAAPDDADLSD